MLGIGNLDHLAAGPRADINLTIGRGGQGERLGVGRVERHGPGGSLLGGLAKDLACVAGGREDRAITGAGKVPHPLGGQRPGRQQRLPQADVPLVRDHHAFAVMLGERRGPLLTPGIELGPGGNRTRQSCHQHRHAQPRGKTHSGTPLRLHPMFHVVLVSR